MTIDDREQQTDLVVQGIGEQCYVVRDTVDQSNKAAMLIEHTQRVLAHHGQPHGGLFRKNVGPVSIYDDQLWPAWVHAVGEHVHDPSKGF